MNEIISYKEVGDELEKFNLVPYANAYTYEEIKKEISVRINNLITNNFSFLISLFYRLDISEIKLKQALNSAGSNPAGDIIADIIIERQLQKIKSRKSFPKKDGISEEEKW